MTTLERAIETAEVAARRIRADAIEDGHDETAGSCWEFWQEEAESAVLDSLTREEARRVWIAFREAWSLR